MQIPFNVRQNSGAILWTSAALQNALKHALNLFTMTALQTNFDFDEISTHMIILFSAHFSLFLFMFYFHTELLMSLLNRPIPFASSLFSAATE